MQQNRLQIKGMSHQLPPAMCGDGECSRIVNLRCRDGIWEAVGEPRLLYTPEETSRKVIFLHCNEAYKHYISYDGTNLYFEAEEKDGEVFPTGLEALCEISGLSRIESVGNTLVVITDTEIFYLLYRNGIYEILGTRPDMPEISFYLGGSIQSTEIFDTYTLKVETRDDGVCRLSDTDKRAFISWIYGTYSKCKSKLLSDGYFAHPFLVRYALRMYDGSYILPSPPVVMLQSDKADTLNNIEALCELEDGYLRRFVENKFNLRGESLYYNIGKCDLSKWSDIVTGIDVFISKEIPVVKQVAMTENDYRYEIRNIGGKQTRIIIFDVPQLTEEEVKRRLSEEVVFFKVASFSGKEQIAQPFSLEYNCDLNNLEQQDVLPLDNFSHHRITAKTSYVYNGRLHLGGISMYYSSGFPLSVFALTQNRYNGVDLVDIDIQRGYIEVYMNGSDGERRLVNSFESRMSLKGLSSMISYPDSRAYKMKVRIYDDVGGKQYGITVDLKSSQDQNMAYYVSPDLKPITFTEISEPDESKIPEEINAVEHTPNKLRVSQINNPFVFPQEFTYILSGGEITDLAAATAALSQGQYGEFPLYVFTTEGIWALQQGSEGVLYSNQHPVNREVCLSSNLIVPIDNAVVYLSEQGVMALQGAESNLLSPVFGGVPDALPQDSSDGDSISLSEDFVPFRKYIQGKCTAGYNYIRQEIIFLNADYRFCYVFGLSFSSWYCRIVDWRYLYNLYPGLLAGDENSRLYDLCSEDQSDTQISVITRPIKLLPDIYKRISHIALRCSVQRADLVCKVWGAQEAEGRYSLLYRFRITGDVPGQIRMRPVSPPFKYHRIAWYGTVSSDAHFDVIDLGFDPVSSGKKLR